MASECLSAVILDLGEASFSNNSKTGIASQADATLTYVPGIGSGNEGALVAIGGGDDSKVADIDSVLVYTVGNDSWATVATSGDAPSGRVNHCAVRGTAFIDGVWQVRTGFL